MHMCDEHMTRGTVDFHLTKIIGGTTLGTVGWEWGSLRPAPTISLADHCLVTKVFIG